MHIIWLDLTIQIYGALEKTVQSRRFRQTYGNWPEVTRSHSKTKIGKNISDYFFSLSVLQSPHTVNFSMQSTRLFIYFV